MFANNRLLSAALILAVAASTAALVTPNNAESSELPFLTSKTPYAAPTSQDYSAPPEGYQIMMIQHIARHGSRGLSSADDDDLMLQLWQSARENGALTPLGERLGPEIEKVMAVHETIGYGQLSGLGEREHRETAERLVKRRRAFLEQAARDGKRVSSSHSGRSRAAASGEAFFEGWLGLLPQYAELLDAPYADPEVVYFNDGDNAEAYDAYVDNEPRINALLNALEEHPRTEQAVSETLLRLFNSEFVAQLERGELTFVAAADDEDRLESAFDAMEALYGLYVIAPNLRDEAEIDFSPFIPEQHLAWFAYIDDAGSFYERGPSLADSDMTYRNAAAAVSAMIDNIQLAVDNERPYAGDFRFTHAQALMPLAAFLGIEGASQGVTVEHPYSYESNPWRASWVSPMAANVQWEAFSDRSGDVIVRMLHNEKEAAFSDSCKALPDYPYYYELDELSRCLLGN